MRVCFEESFHFRLKGFVNKISHSLYTNKWYKYVLENYLAYFQYTNIKRKEREWRIHYQIGFWPTSRFKWCWEVPCQSPSGVPIGKGSQAACLLHGWEFKDCSLGFALIMPGRSQTDIIINLWICLMAGTHPWAIKSESLWVEAGHGYVSKAPSKSWAEDHCFKPSVTSGIISQLVCIGEWAQRIRLSNVICIGDLTQCYQSAGTAVTENIDSVASTTNICFLTVLEASP